MAKLNKSDLKGQSIDEMESDIRSLNQELFEMRNQLSLYRKLEKPHLMKQLRRQKARMLTFLAQKQKGKIA